MGLRSGLAVALAAVVVSSLAGQSWSQESRATAAKADMRQASAEEQAPEALLGAWKADVAASTYAGARPRENIRTFSYTAAGKVLITSLTLGANGRAAMLHWTVQLDGAPGDEFQSFNGSTPTNVVRLKKQDDTTLVMTVSKHGVVTLTGSFRLSADGKTLTYDYGGATGRNVIIYHKWDVAG